MNYTNLAQKTNFIAGSDKFLNLPFFLTSVNIPGINISHPEVGGRGGAAIHLPGNNVQFNELNINMLIDEDFLIYQELMSIINKNIEIENNKFRDFYFDFYIEITNTKGNKVMKFEFKNCRIESIGDVELDTQDEETEHTLSMTMKYDYFVREDLRRFRLVTTEADKIPTTDEIIYNFRITETFAAIDENWQLWGFPKPIISSEIDALNGTGLDSNGGGTNESGAVLNGAKISSTEPFKITFRAKQPLANNNDSFYLDFGITEGIGIDSTTNGRTGNTVLGVRLDSSGEIQYTVTNDVVTDLGNSGDFHEYTFISEPNVDLGVSNYKILQDGVEKKSGNFALSNHEDLYIYIQGKSVDGVHVIDNISGEHN